MNDNDACQLRLHALSFIRNTENVDIDLFLNFSQKVTSNVAYLLLNFRSWNSMFLNLISL